MSDAVYASCAVHADAMASFSCEGCGKDLCYSCVDEGQYLNRCRSCGERAHRLEETWSAPEEDAPADLPMGDILYQGKSKAPQPVKMADDPLTIVFNHVVVPGATIGMVASLLFFLLDVRSVFLPGSANLKWLGFWFVFATVLIARYGKAQGDAERVGCYSAGLFMATMAAILLGPWQREDPSALGIVVNGAILLAVWRFATAVTSGLALEGEERERTGRRLYGLERLAVEAWQRHRRPGRDASKGGKDYGVRLPVSRSPNRAVAFLAAGVMVVFALGEPALLNGPPQAAARGFASMVVFLLSTGTVLGAAAVLDVFRRVRDAEGSVSATLLPRRMLAAALSMALLLSIALGMPGVRRSGDAAAPSAAQGAASDDASAAESRTGNSGENGNKADEKGGQQEGKGRSMDSSAGDPQRPSEASPESNREAGRGTGFGGFLIHLFTSLGKWLRFPALLAVLIIGIVSLRRLMPLLGGWKGLKERWLQALSRWAQLFRFGSRDRGRKTRPVDPWYGVDALASLPADEAVRRAYGHALLALDALGYRRGKDRTPNELLASLPRRCRALQPPLKRLTELYVDLAYGGQPATDAERQQAVDSLARMRRLATTIEPLSLLE